jgi:hypothetical protein
MALKSPILLNNFDVPRTISNGLKISIFFKDPIAVIGTIFFLFGMIFPIVFGSLADFKSAFSFSENDPTVKGVIVDKTATSSSENKRRIYDYSYQYSIDGKTHTGHSFSTSYESENGDTVNVLFVAKQPELSHIEGMRAAPFGIWVVAFTSVFPIIGLIFIIFSINKFKKNIYLIKNGILTHGKVIGKEPTNTKINNKTVYKVFFQYKSQDGTLQEAFNKSHLTYNLGDEEKEPLVYDSQNPQKAVLLDTLPKRVRAIISGE